MRKDIVCLVLCLIISVGLVSCGKNVNPSQRNSSSDTIAPSVPTGLTATAASSSSIGLNWTASTDDTGVTGYKIFRNGSQISTSTTKAFSDTGLSSSTTYTYTVSAYDNAGNTSAQSTPASATTLATGVTDTTPPTAPTNLTATAASSSQIDLSWAASTDNIGVAGYEIYRDAALISNVTGTNHSDTGLSANTSYMYTVKAFDGANNKSTASASASAITPASGSPTDTQAPNVPTGLSVTADSSSQITLSWTASSDNAAVTGYKVYRDGTYLKSVSATIAADTGLTASTQYCYALSAYDAAGNESLQSSQTCTTTKAMWSVTTIDNSCDVGSYPSIAIDTSNNVYVAYYDHTNHTIKHANNSSGTWTTSALNAVTQGITVIDSSRIGGAERLVKPTIAVDANDKAHISYFHSPGSGFILKYLTNESGSWSTLDVGTSSHYSGFSSSLAIDSNNKVHIGYPTTSNYTYNLKYSTNSSGTWVTESIYSNTCYFCSMYPSGDISLALYSNNRANIVYNLDQNSSASMSGSLEYAIKSSDTWASTAIVSYSVGFYPSLAVDPNNKLHISYTDGASLKHVTNASGSWVSTVVLASPGELHSSIAVDANSNVHIVNGVKHITNASGAWVSSTIDPSLSSTAHTWSNRAIALDSHGRLHIVYAILNSSTNQYELKYFEQQ